MPLAGNIAKAMTSNRKQFTVIREILNAVSRDQRLPDVVCLCFVLLDKKSPRILAWISGFSFSRGRRRKQPAKKSLTQRSLLQSSTWPPHSVISVSERISQSELFPAVMSTLHKFFVHQKWQRLLFLISFGFPRIFAQLLFASKIFHRVWKVCRHSTAVCWNF